MSYKSLIRSVALDSSIHGYPWILNLKNGIHGYWISNQYPTWIVRTPLQINTKHIYILLNDDVNDYSMKIVEEAPSSVRIPKIVEMNHPKSKAVSY